ncbi:facilitated trehalose transporter Tret1-like [Anoplophora glabripennis]|uniref:facilitated trehalose transporter Tret1-like n=1 Tax=Anoplophora glabripennis TaxID=217634 RepID=UPI0008737D92|nr:facilitated trehalose transporter Tret1-like [Anoplophora glabripennis]
MTISTGVPFRTGGSRIYQYIAAVAVNLSIICSEMHYGWSSPFGPVLANGKYKFTITNNESSWLTVIPLTGAIFGAFVTGLVVDIFGRKRMIIFSFLPFVASWLLIGFAESSTLMFVGRFLAGTTDGLSFTAVPMYLGEIADPQIRGLLVSTCPVCIVFGILLINILGACLPLDTTAFISTILPLLLLIIFPWMPESPYFYLMKGNEEEARESLRIFRGVEDVTVELNRISSAVKEQQEKKGSFLDLFRVESNRKGMFITLGLRSFQQLTGSMVIIFYCKTIFEEARGFSPSLSTIIYFSVQLVLSIASSFVVDFFGRKPLLIVSIIGSALSLLAIAIYLYLQEIGIDTTEYNFAPLVALICFVVTFSIGLHTIPLLIMGEIFPTDVKALALCVMDIYFSVLVICISMFFHWSKCIGMYVPFLTFTGCCILGLLFILFYVPETKRKTLEDIQAELQGEGIVGHKIVVNEADLYELN